MPENKYYSLINPLKREGTSQNQRQLAALDPAKVKVDDRTLQDFLVFASDFARQIYYYNQSHTLDGDWQDFFAYDLSFIIASIEKTNPKHEKDTFQGIIKLNPSVDGLYLLFQSILSVVGKLDNWHADLPAGNNYRDQISRLVRANLAYFAPRIRSFELGAYEVFGEKGFPDAYSEESKLKYTGLSAIWNVGSIENIEADVALFQQIWQPQSDNELPPNPTDEEKLSTAYNKLNLLFIDLYNIYFQVIKLSSRHFDKSLEVADHEPHIALFIGFLFLYQKVQEDSNKITSRHLDFYYKDVLGLQLKVAVPDKVHLFFKLAKHIDEHKLTKGARFLAGKDGIGANLYYTLDEDIVLNKAQVESVHTVYTDRDHDTDDFKNIYAAPIANSSDGNGGEFEDENKPSWMTFGSSQMPEVNIGFAIASNELLLGEGNRTITLTVNYSGSNVSALSNTAIPVKFSGEEEMFAPAASAKIIEPTSSSFKIKIELKPDEPAVTAFDEKIHGEKLGTALPVMKVMIDQSGSVETNKTLDLLKDITITSLDLKVEVKGATNIIAYSDLGLLDTKKTILPFGVSPVVGSSFYLGSKEAFQKNLNKVILDITWEELPKGNDDVLNFQKYYEGYDDGPQVDDLNCKISILKSEGNTVISTGKNFFSTPTKDENGNTIENTYQIAISNDKLGPSIIENELENYGSNSDYGFLKFDLSEDFRHREYPPTLSRQLIAKSKLPNYTEIGALYYKYTKSGTPEVLTKLDGVFKEPDLGNHYNLLEAVIPNEPYTPKFKSISFAYESRSVLSDSGKKYLRFLHLHPFTDTYQLFNTVSSTKLLPQLHKSSSAFEVKKLEGMLLLGIKDLKPKQSLSILFQVAENTADADADVAQVHWQYLADNTWKDFKEYEITSDTTISLITSGIITFSIPAAINKKNTILSDQLHWIRAWVEKDSEAVSEMINIHTQAAQITYSDNSNDPLHLNTPLSAGAISKLEKDDASIDSITQAYDSFGGRMAEDSLKYYIRVSERLRHKGRAITIYDYERMVLEEFPEIYKVKCINHTNIDDLIAPGHVLVAVIPDYTNMKAVDRRQPKVTKGRLEEIRKFLEANNTTFVGEMLHNGKSAKYMHVVNPKYKRLKVDFLVKFTEDISAPEFYKRELRSAIIRFLSPWAYDDVAELNFGGKVFKSSIQNFVEQQTYVDYITNFKMMDSEQNVDVDYIEADTARTILVPDDEENFVINLAVACLSENTIKGEGLGYATINTDDFKL